MSNVAKLKRYNKKRIRSCICPSSSNLMSPMIINIPTTVIINPAVKRSKKLRWDASMPGCHSVFSLVIVVIFLVLLLE